MVRRFASILSSDIQKSPFAAVSGVIRQVELCPRLQELLVPAESLVGCVLVDCQVDGIFDILHEVLPAADLGAQHPAHEVALAAERAGGRDVDAREDVVSKIRKHEAVGFDPLQLAGLWGRW